jgi:hypothetical protein
MSRYSFGVKTKANDARLKILENKNVKAAFFERFGAGTSGTLERLPGSSIVLDGWSEGVDAVVSTIGKTGKPTYESPVTAEGSIVTTTMDEHGNWKLSGIPKKYPIAIIYTYKIPLPSFRPTQALEAIMVEEYDIKGSAETVRVSLLAEICVLRQQIQDLSERVSQLEISPKKVAEPVVLNLPQFAGIRV